MELAHLLLLRRILGREEAAEDECGDEATESYEELELPLRVQRE